MSVCSLGTDLGPACGCQTEPEVWGCKLQPETDAWLSGRGRRGSVLNKMWGTACGVDVLSLVLLATEL